MKINTLVKVLSGSHKSEIGKIITLPTGKSKTYTVMLIGGRSFLADKSVLEVVEDE